MTHEQKVRLGIFIVVFTAIFIAVFGFFILPKLNEPGEEYFIDFKDVSVHGLYVGSPVKYRGVEVGKVVRMAVNQRDLDSVLVYVKVRKEMVIKKDMRAVLAYTGLTGQKYVELSGGSLASEKLPPHGEIITGRGLGETAEDIVSSIEEAVKNLNSLLSSENQKNLTRFLQNMEKGSEELSGLISARRQSLDAAITNFEKASAGLARTAETLAPLSENVNRLVQNFEVDSRRALDNISQRFSEAELGGTIRELREFLEKTKQAVARVDSLVATDRKELDRILTGLAEAAENLARVSREVSEDPSLLLRSRKEKKK
jgi:phospholipid/cholesterol/gamma-HCH transport system substrate-binding protein